MHGRKMSRKLRVEKKGSALLSAHRWTSASVSPSGINEAERLRQMQNLHKTPKHRITESTGLEKFSEIIESNH